MNISLTRIEVEAFKAFSKKSALGLADFPPGLHFVRGQNLTNTRLGSNGAGKSTFFSDAVTWCLYGRTVGGLRTTDVRSWLADGPPRVAVGIGEQIVQRGPRATDLTIDDKQVGQETVDALVGLSYEAWCQAIIWGQGMPLFFDLAPGAKMTLLSDALGLERWERRAQAAGARVKRLEGRLRGVEGEVRGLEAARDHAQDALESARDAADRWGAEQAARIKKNEGEASAARARAASLEEKRGKAALAADSAGTRARMLREEITPAREELAAMRQQHRDLERTRDNSIQTLEEARAHLAAFRDEGSCPTCGQRVAKADAKKHARELEQQISELEEECDRTTQSLTRGAKKISQTTASLQKKEEDLRKLEEAEARATGDLRLLERELAAAQAELAAAERELRAAQEGENPHRQAAQDARRRLREVEADLREKEELAKKLAASVERAQFWTRGFRDIRLGIIDDILDDLRGTTAEVLDGLGLGEWEVEYTTERETKSGAIKPELTVMVRSPTAPPWRKEPMESAEALRVVRWENYSGGERQRLRLAGALALSEVLLAHAGASIDFRVLDEPTRGLSREGTRDLVEMLGDYAERAGLKIFYADHTSEEGLAFASTVTIISDAKGARVEV